MRVTEIALTNAVPDQFDGADCEVMLLATRALLVIFCAEKGLVVPPIAYYPDRTTVPATATEVALLDVPPPAVPAGTEAYHEDVDDAPDGKCFAGYLLKSGGSKFTGALAVTIAFTHEVLELILNPRTDLVLTGPPPAPDGKTYATIWAECVDAAQGEHYAFEVDDARAPGGKVEVWTCGFVTQEWEDAEGRPPYSLPDGIVQAPLTPGPQGYGGYQGFDGATAIVFAPDVHPVIRALKEQHGRLADAMRGTVALPASVAPSEPTAPTVVSQDTQPK